MNLARFLKEDSISLEFGSDLEVPEELAGRALEAWKEEILARLAELLDRSGRVANRSKLEMDLVHRERKASTAMGGGIAVPHVRTMQAREFTMGVAVARTGLPFGSADGELVRIFIALVAPPYDDKLYLQVYQQLARALGTPEVLEALLSAKAPGEIIRLLSDA